MEWPQEALRSVAQHFLQKAGTPGTPQLERADELLPISQVDLKDGVFAGVVEQWPQLAGFRKSSEAT